MSRAARVATFRASAHLRPEKKRSAAHELAYSLFPYAYPRLYPRLYCAVAISGFYLDLLILLLFLLRGFDYFVPALCVGFCVCEQVRATPARCNCLFPRAAWLYAQTICGA